MNRLMKYQSKLKEKNYRELSHIQFLHYPYATSNLSDIEGRQFTGVFYEFIYFTIYAA